MGNILIDDKGKSNVMKAFESYVDQNPELVSRTSNFYEGKLFRTLAFKSHLSYLVFKVYIVRKQMDASELLLHENNFLFYLKQIGTRKYHNLLPFQKIINFTDRQSYQPNLRLDETGISNSREFLAVARQQLSTTLQERVVHQLPYCYRHFYTVQLLVALNTLHSLNLYHGHLRSSNVLLTSNDHLMLSDFASYKPYYLRIDQLGEFNNVYETSAQRCTIAPEKFIFTSETPNFVDIGSMDKQLLTALQQMDMFSLGCVLAEIYLQGENLFNFEQMMKYIKGEYDPVQIVKKIENIEIQELIINLISTKISSRMNASAVLQYFFDRVLTDEKKNIYVWLYYINYAFNWSHQFNQADTKIALLRKLFPQILKEICLDRDIEMQIAEENVGFRFYLPMAMQKLNILSMFKEAISNCEPSLNSMIQNINKVNINEQQQQYKFSGHFNPQSDMKLCQEPFDNVSNLRIKNFQECYLQFNDMDDLEEIRMSKEKLGMSQVQKLKASMSSSQNMKSSTERKSGQIDNKFEWLMLQQRESSKILQQKITLYSDFKQKKVKKVALSEEVRLIGGMIASQMRNVRFLQTKLCLLEMMDFLSIYMKDTNNFYFTLTAIASFFQDSESQVVCYAFSLFLQILKQIDNPFENAIEIKLFRFYVWEQIRKMIRNEDDPQIKKCVAENLNELADVIYKYQMLIQEFYQSQNIPKEQIKAGDFQSEFLDQIQTILQINKSLESQHIYLQKIGYICKLFNIPQNNELLRMVISSLNNTDLKFTILQNLFSIFDHWFPVEQNQEFILACIDQYLIEQNEIHIFYLLRYFTQVIQMRYFNIEKEQKYLKKIVPLIIFPNLWIRQQAMSFITVLIEKYSPLKVFTYFQDAISKYLKEEVAFLSPEILQMLAPDMLRREWIDFKNKTIDQMSIKHLSDRDRLVVNHFITNYLSKILQFNIVDKTKDERLSYNDKIIALNNRHELENNLSQRINELFLNAFKADLFYFGEEETTRYTELIQQYKNEKQISKPPDQLLIDLINEKKKIDLSSNQMIIRKIKRLQALLTQFQSNSSYIIRKNGLVSQADYRNILNIINIIQQIEIKSQQMGVKEDISYSRICQYSQPPIIRPYRPTGQLVTTISEHTDIVSCVSNFRNQQFFLSGSHDGTVRIYDLNKIEQDFTYGSVSSVKCVESEDKIHHKIVALRAMDFTDSFLIGTNTGFIELYKLDHLSKDKGTSQLRTFKRANSDIKKIEFLKNDFSENVFVYATSMGDIVVEDIRSKSQAVTFSVGKERGIVSCMVQRGSSQSTCIGTLNGYCMLYDLRCNLISNVFQLLSTDDQPLPIFSMANFNRVNTFEGVEATELTAIGFQSNNNEVGFWNLSDLNEYVNPSMYLVCTDKKNVIIQNPKLRNLYKSEQFKNFNNKLEERFYYEFVGSYQQMDLIQYLKDPLTSSQNQIKEKWLINTKNLYANMKAAFEAKSSVTSMICLPLNNSGQQSLQKLENTVITASSDRCVQAWNLLNDGGKQGERAFEREGQGTIICQPNGYFDVQRRFIQVKSGDVYTIQDYEVQQQNKNQIIGKEQSVSQPNIRREYKIDHKDCICDMTFIEREQGLLVTGSRDSTVKIWK